ncbi:hypothetical protein EC988_006028, partial [Linderina pennispora]
TLQKPGGKPNPIDNMLKAHDTVPPNCEPLPGNAQSDSVAGVSSTEHAIGAASTWATSAPFVRQPGVLDMAASVALDNSLCSPLNSQGTPTLTYATHLHTPLVTTAAIATPMAISMHVSGSDNSLLFTPEMFPIANSAGMSQMGILASGNASPHSINNVL